MVVDTAVSGCELANAWVHSLVNGVLFPCNDQCFC